MVASDESSRRGLLAVGAAAAGAAMLTGAGHGTAAKNKKNKKKTPKPPLVAAIVRITNVTARDSGSVFLAQMDVSLLDLRQDPATPRESPGKSTPVPGGSAAAMEAAIHAFVLRIAVDDWGWNVPAERLAVLIA